jgi:hypothetical protein
MVEDALTLQDEEIVLVALEESEELDDAGMIYPPHDLDLFEDVGALEGVSSAETTG